MENLNITGATEPTVHTLMFEYGIQTTIGLITFPLVLILFMSCIKHRPLRRRNIHIILAALSFGQVIDVIASILAGIDRLYTVFYEPNRMTV